MKEKDIKLFVDMDGVLTDFVAQMVTVLNVSPDEAQLMMDVYNGAEPKVKLNGKLVEKEEELFNTMRTSRDFWRDIPVMEGAKEFFGELKARCDDRCDIQILSRYSIDQSYLPWLDEVKNIKTIWFLRNIDMGFDPNKLILTRHSKKDFVIPEARCILIDDSLNNVADWVRKINKSPAVFEKGGNAILFQNYEQVLQQVGRSLTDEKKIARHQGMDGIKEKARENVYYRTDPH